MVLAVCVFIAGGGIFTVERNNFIFSLNDHLYYSEHYAVTADMVIFISFKHYATISKALELYIAMQKLFSSFPLMFLFIS